MWWRRFGEKLTEDKAMATVNENHTNVQATNENTAKFIIYVLVSIISNFFIVNRINKYLKEYVKKKITNNAVINV